MLSAANGVASTGAMPAQVLSEQRAASCACAAARLSTPTPASTATDDSSALVAAVHEHERVPLGVAEQERRELPRA